MTKGPFRTVHLLCILPFLATGQLACAPANQQPSTSSGYSQQQEMPAYRTYTWNQVRYVLPALPQYRFFDESVFGYQSIKDFTLTEYQPLDVVDFDLLVPDSIGKDPYIHIYSFDLIRDAIISNSDFAQNKREWITNLDNGTFNALAELVWNSEKFKKRFSYIDLAVVKQKNYVILENSNDKLTYLMCVGSGDSDKVVAYTSHIHINGTVVFVKVWLSSASSVDDVLHTTEIAEGYLTAFLAKNVKTPTN